MAAIMCTDMEGNRWFFCVGATGVINNSMYDDGGIFDSNTSENLNQNAWINEDYYLPVFELSNNGPFIWIIKSH